MTTQLDHHRHCRKCNSARTSRYEDRKKANGFTKLRHGKWVTEAGSAEGLTGGA